MTNGMAVEMAGPRRGTGLWLKRAGLLALGVAAMAAGLDVFAGSDAASGPAHLAGPTGGYVAGFALAAVLTRALAARGWDPSPWRTGAAMALGTVLIRAPGPLRLRVPPGEGCGQAGAAGSPRAAASSSRV